MVMVNPDEDGISHINIYTKGKTELGRGLTNLADIPLVHPVHGKFRSMEGYWYHVKFIYLGIHHSVDFRSLSGFEAKKQAQQIQKGIDDIDKKEIQDSFKEDILEGIRCKLRQNKQLLKLLIQSDLPLEHYYFYGDTGNYKVYQLPQYKWMVEEIERIRSVCKDYYKDKSWI